MSFKRDPFLILLYAIGLTIFISKFNIEETFNVSLSFSSIREASSSAPMLIGIIYYYLAKLLLYLKNVGGYFVTFLAAYVALFLLYLISWFVTEIGRSFIKDWGARGGPNQGIFQTWKYCTQANLLYLVAWWLCPVNHRPVTNLVYNLNLMRFWPFTILLILLIGLIPGATFSGHYQDVFRKVLRNYPYK